MNHSIVSCTITVNATDKETTFDDITDALELLEGVKQYTKINIDDIVTITVEFKEERYIHPHSIDPIEYWTDQINFKTLKYFVDNAIQAC